MIAMLAILSVTTATDTVHFSAEAGLVNTSGNTRLTTVNIGDKLALSVGRWGVNQGFSVIYGTTDGTTSTSLWRGSLRGDRSLGSRTSLFVLSEFDRNKFAGITSRYGESFGLGFKVVAAKRDRLDAEIGVGYIWQNVVAPAVAQQFAAGRLALMYQRNLGEAAKFSQSIELLPNLKVGDDLRIVSETSLSAPIARGIAMKASYIVRYDGLPEPGFEKTDRILTTGIQVSP